MVPSDDEADPAAAFDALSDELRVRIVTALVERQRESPEDPALSFTALRRRVGTADSGKFNYHLDKLRDTFVEKTAEGYRLTHAGQRIAGALLSGAYTGSGRLGPVELDDPDPFTGEPLVATYEGGEITVEGGEIDATGERFAYSTAIPPGAAEGRSIDEVIRVATLALGQRVDAMQRDICPMCYGRVERTVNDEPEEEGFTYYEFVAQCTRCGYLARGPVGMSVIRYPPVVAFFEAHGEDVVERPAWTLEFLAGDRKVTRVSAAEEPLRLRIDVELDDDHLYVTLDDAANVVGTERA